MSSSVFRPVVLLVAAAVAASCGSSYGDDGGQANLPPRVDGGDDAGDGGTGGDAGPSLDATPTTDGSTPACDPGKPFGTPVAIGELNTAELDYVSSVAPDELTIYVGSNHGVTGLHLFYATRSSTTAAWGARQPLFPNGSFDDWSVSVTADGLTAIVSSDRNGNNSDLYVATRATPLASFGVLSVVAGTTNSSANEEGPHWSPDGKTLYFDSTRGGNRDIYRTAVAGSTFGAPVALTELQSPALDAAPVVSPDELTIYFLSTRAPTTDGDIYVATRAKKTDPFSNIHPLENVNSGTLDAPGHISPDGCTLYLTSDRSGNTDIFVARRPK